MRDPLLTEDGNMPDAAQEMVEAAKIFSLVKNNRLLIIFSSHCNIKQRMEIPQIELLDRV